MVFFFGSILSAKNGVAICFSQVALKSMLKYNNRKSEFIKVTLFKAKDVEMAYILQSDLGTSELTFKTDKSASKASKVFLEN